MGVSRELFFWNDSDISILKDNYNKLPVEEIEKLLNFKFSIIAIKTKAGKLGLTVSQLWTPEEHQLLVENYPKMAPWQVAELIPSKSLDAIKHRAEHYKIRSGVNRTYTSEENDFVIQNYLKMSDEELAQKLGRTRMSVKQHRNLLKLVRPNKALETSIAEYLRQHNYFWRTESADSCGNQCVITGQTENLQIHHKYSMNKILDAVLSEFPVEKYQSCEEIPVELLERIRFRFYEEQRKHGYGVCVCEDYHKKFHSIYGFGNNTPEQWDEFVTSLKQ